MLDLQKTIHGNFCEEFEAYKLNQFPLCADLIGRITNSKGESSTITIGTTLPFYAKIFSKFKMRNTTFKEH